jgi:flagellin
MVINTNISALTAQEASKNTNNILSSSLEKLSSGLKINKASDDASGLAIADKLRTQVTSINQGVANGNSAVTLLQIADKSMSEQSSILDTIKAKLIQANTDTTSDDGREAIRKDVVKLLEQLDNIAEQTNYNGNVLLQGSATETGKSNALSFQIGESSADIISNNALQSNTVGLGGGSENLAGEDMEANSTYIMTGNMTLGASGASTTVKVSGNLGTVTGAGTTMTNVDTKTAATLKADIDSGDLTGVTYSGDTFTIASGANLSSYSMGNATLTNSAGTIQINTAEDISVTNTGTVDLTISSGSSVTGGQALANLANLGSGTLTKAKAETFQAVVDASITALNGYRGDIGSTQNQAESAVRNLMTQSTNLSAAESIIRDVDYAEESANFNKQNIISQAGSYAISQANTVQQNVLKLLQ